MQCLTTSMCIIKLRVSFLLVKRKTCDLVRYLNVDAYSHFMPTSVLARNCKPSGAKV